MTERLKVLLGNPLSMLFWNSAMQWNGLAVGVTRHPS